MSNLPVHPWNWPVGTLLHRLTPGTRHALLALGVRRLVAPGEQLLREGEYGSHVILLRRAFAKVTVAMSDGRDALIAIRVSGDMIGEMSALNGRPRSATVTTCGQSTISVIHNNEFRPFLRDHPDAAIEIAGMVADRLRWANRRRVDFATYPAKIRLVRILVELATHYSYRTPAGIEIAVQLTQPELATLCGAAEITIQRALRDLRTAGLVHTGHRRTVIKDIRTLRTLADLDSRA